MRILVALLLGTFALTTAAEANGTAKKSTATKRTVVQREMVYAYEPRVYVEPEPLFAWNVGHGIFDDCDFDLFGINERRRWRYHYREDFYGGRIYGGPRIYVEPGYGYRRRY